MFNNALQLELRRRLHVLTKDHMTMLNDKPWIYFWWLLIQSINDQWFGSLHENGTTHAMIVPLYENSKLPFHCPWSTWLGLSCYWCSYPLATLHVQPSIVKDQIPITWSASPHGRAAVFTCSQRVKPCVTLFDTAPKSTADLPHPRVTACACIPLCVCGSIVGGYLK